MYASSPAVRAITPGEHRSKDAGAICDSGSVVESLGAALWCAETTGTFEIAALAGALVAR